LSLNDPPVYAIVARDQQVIHFRCAQPPTANPDKYRDELLRVSGCGLRFCFWGTRDRREAVSDEHRKKRKTSTHGACSANSAAKSRAVMIRVDL
jgi:hypothetical protein